MEFGEPWGGACEYPQALAEAARAGPRSGGEEAASVDRRPPYRYVERPMPKPCAALFVENLSIRAAALALLAGGALAWMGGCANQRTSPFENRLQADLRRSMMDTARRELKDSEKSTDTVRTGRDNGESELMMTPEQIAALQKMAGMGSYEGVTLPLAEDLLGKPTKTVKVSLERMIKSAVERNIAVQYARLGPAISGAQEVAAEAAFDWTFFSNLSFQNINEPSISGNGSGASTQSQTTSGSLGLRRTLVSGGRLTVQYDTSYIDNKTPNATFRPDPSIPSSLTLQYDQPLLRGFGSEVTQAEIRVARNAERTAVQTLRRDLMSVITDTEKQYWTLTQNYQDVLILQRLLDRGIRVRDQLRVRVGLDINSAQVADAQSRISRRRSDVTAAQTQLALTSDRLKQQVNDPEFPVGSPVVLIPADAPVDQPIVFSLAESIRSALRYRPEVQSAIIAIDDASIRQVVARNAKLPDLGLRLQTKLSGLDDAVGDSNADIYNRDFVDYIVGLSFEQPLGNRRAEADYRRRVLERMQSVLAYKNTVQQVVNEVLDALRRLALFYQQIDQTHTEVLATAEALRILELEKEVGPAGFTLERLNLELNDQERLADSETRSVQSLTQYNSSLADLFKAMGTTLDRNNIQFVAPTVDDVLGGVHGVKGWAGENVLKVERKP